MKAKIVQFILRDHEDWDWWATRQDYAVDVPDLGRVTVVEADDIYYGDYEGYRDVKIVFKVEGVNGTQYFQQNGETSSYSTSWLGAFYEVKGTPKTVLVYERV